MVLTYLLLNYDIKHIPDRPQAQWVGTTIIPPLAATIEVRRRKATV
jgi:hypothetical protein